MREGTARYSDRLRLMVLYGVVAAMLVLGSTFSAHFRSAENLVNIVVQAIPLGMLALGQTLALLTAGVDLSVGSLMSLSTALSAMIIGYNPLSIVGGILAVLIVSVGFGLLNGWSRTKLGIPPFIATLCTLMIGQGLAHAVLKQPGGFIPSESVAFLQAGSGIFRMPLVYFALAIIGLYVFLNHRPMGRHFYAVGASVEAARASGLRVTSIIITSQVLCSLFAGMGGILLAARIQSGDPNIGGPFLLDSIVAALIGGTTFTGGKGGILGTVAGVLILSIISNGMNMFAVNPFFSYIIKGGLFVAAILAYSYERR